MKKQLEDLAQAMEENAKQLRKKILKEREYEELLLLTHETTHILNYVGENHE